MALVDRCKLCSSTRIRARYRLPRYRLTVLRCDECTLQFVGDDLPDEQIDALYAEPAIADYFLSLEERHARKFAPRLEELPRLGVMPGQRVLDVGCGGGEFCALAHAAGYDVLGIDVAAPPVETARRLHPGVEFRLAEAGELVASHAERFDLVTLWDVIEHVKDPHELVASCAALVRPAGLLALGTPNGDSLFDRVADVAYRTVRPLGELMLMQRYSQWHLQIWTRRTLSRLVADHGLDVSSVRSHRELSAAPSFYLRQQRFTRLASLAHPLDGVIEAALPVRNKLTLYARTAARGRFAGAGARRSSSSS
jgi:2-polyprenyl-3-methyl-5-hydroxy-6-metoxy-1,4-benzoquinol methylase